MPEMDGFETLAEIRRNDATLPVIIFSHLTSTGAVATLEALALGATAVGIGRPYIWGLGAFGQPGVDRVLEILNNELRLAMVGCGARSIREITSASIMRRS